ncbi:MAG: hypothetical protein ACE5JG_09225 [Planctomycetota bacterium]
MALAEVDWGRYADLLVLLAERVQAGTADGATADAEAMHSMASLMADLAPLCRVLGIRDVRVAMRHPAVHAGFLAGILGAVDAEGDAASRKELLQHLLPPGAVEGSASARLVEDAEADLAMYLRARTALPAQAHQRLEEASSQPDQ